MAVSRASRAEQGMDTTLAHYPYGRTFDLVTYVMIKIFFPRLIGYLTYPSRFSVVNRSEVVQSRSLLKDVIKLIIFKRRFSGGGRK